MIDTKTILSANDLKSIGGTGAKLSICRSLAEGLEAHAHDYGLDKPWRMAHFLAQIAHESARFRTTEEYASGAAYEGRGDLGNVKPGDGRRFKGHGLIQTTGRANHRRLTVFVGGDPDFEANPKLVAEFPWALISALYYWDRGNPTGKSLNVYADRNDIEMITRRINGGLYGYADRLALHVRAGLVLLGFAPTAVREFQNSADLAVDGIAGPRTRAAIHGRLKQ